MGYIVCVCSTFYLSVRHMQAVPVFHASVDDPGCASAAPVQRWYGSEVLQETMKRLSGSAIERWLSHRRVRARRRLSILITRLISMLLRRVTCTCTCSPSRPTVSF